MAKSEVFGGKLGTVHNDAPKQGGHDAKYAHFTASDKVYHGLETIAVALKASIRNSFAANGCGIIGMDRASVGRQAVIPTVRRAAAVAMPRPEEPSVEAVGWQSLSRRGCAGYCHRRTASRGEPIYVVAQKR